MSGKKGSKLAIVLARSLDIGRGGKVKVGVVEGGFSGSGQSDRVARMDQSYNALVGVVDTIETTLARVDPSVRGELDTRVGDLKEAIQPFAVRDVTNVEDVRQQMLDDIAAQRVVADALLADVQKAALLRAQTITCTPPASIEFGAPVTVALLGARSSGDGALGVYRQATPIEANPFKGPGQGQKIEIRAARSATFLPASLEVSVNVVPAKRSITGTLKAEWTVFEEIKPSSAGLKLSGGADNMEVTSPKNGIFILLGDAVPVEIEAKKTATHEAAIFRQTVKVLQATPTLTWATPAPVTAGTRLSGKQLNAQIDPASLKRALVYTPALNEPAAAGVMELRVDFPGSPEYEKARADVRLLVAANTNELAGTEAMLKGTAWSKPTSEAARKLLKSWDEDDGSKPDGIKTQAKKIMSDIGTMTAEELTDYMNTLVTDPGDTMLQPGTHPNRIWKLKNGLQIRYKSNGDKKNPGVAMFCIEGRLTDGFSNGQDDIAFKLTPDGTPAAKGPKSTIVPPEITDPVAKADYIQGTVRATHLFCRPKEEQVITWKDPADISEDTELGDGQLNAEALGGAAISYEKGAGGALKPKDKLPVGDRQVLKAVTAATKRYNAGEKTVRINVKARTGGTA